MANQSIFAAFERMWQHILVLVGGKANADHTHDDLYYTEAEIDAKIEDVETSINNAATDLTSHAGNTTIHITSTERTDWNNAKINADNALAELQAIKDGSATLPGVDHAAKADKDGNDQNIASTYIKGLSVDGKVITYTKGDNITGTITTQDTTYTLNSFGITATATELNYTDGVTSNIQNQLDNKASSSHKHTFTGSATDSNQPSATSTIYQITDVGTLPSCSYTAPSLSGSVSNRCLTLTWSAGSQTFSAGTLPTRSSVTMPTGTHTHSVTAAGSLGTPT